MDPQTPAARLDILAVLSLVLGIVAFMTVWCCIGYPIGLIAVVLGAVAVSRNQSGGYSGTSKVLALGGILTTAFAILIHVILMAVGQVSKPELPGADKSASTDVTPAPAATDAAPAVDVETAPAAAPPPPPPEPTPPPAPTEPEFVTARKEACAKYDEAPNEIKKSAVFSDYVRAAKAKQGMVTDVRGTLSGIETPQGGNEVWITVSTPLGEFTNNDILVGDKANRTVKKGSAIYNAVGEFAEGASVVVAAANIVPSENPFSERAGVCGDGWIVKYTAIEAPK